MDDMDEMGYDVITVFLLEDDMAMTSAAQAAEQAKGLTFEKVWAMFQETDKKFQETDKKFQETDKKFQESRAEYDRKFQESRAEHELMMADIKKIQRETARIFKENGEQLKEADRIITDLGKQMGGLHNSFGDLVANLVAPNLPSKFRELGYTFTRCSCEMKFKDSEDKTLAEVDAWLEDGDAVMAVEIKGKLLKKDVSEHLERMKVLQSYAKEHGDKRKLLGAVAGGITRKDARDYAVQNGLYVIEQSGDTLKIEMPKGFKPKTW
jgi:hypothetical protein